jgi:uncharacterized protein (DUF58 family)
MKPGYKTTEFIVTILLNVGVICAALAGSLSPRWAAIASSVSVAAYAIARGLAKENPNITVEKKV